MTPSAGGPPSARSPVSRVRFSFAVLRVVPHPHTGEGAPVAVVMQAREAEFIGFRAVTDPARLRALAPDADIDLLVRYLRSCEAIAAGDEASGPIALLSAPERFHWLSAPRSDVLQPSPREYGVTDSPEAELDSLFAGRVLGA